MVQQRAKHEARTTRIYGYMAQKFPSSYAEAIDFQNFFMEINLLSL